MRRDQCRLNWRRQSEILGTKQFEKVIAFLRVGPGKIPPDLRMQSAGVEPGAQRTPRSCVVHPKQRPEQIGGQLLKLHGCAMRGREAAKPVRELARCQHRAHRIPALLRAALNTPVSDAFPLMQKPVSENHHSAFNRVDRRQIVGNHVGGVRRFPYLGYENLFWLRSCQRIRGSTNILGNVDVRNR